MIPGSAKRSFKEEKEAYDICKLTINARSKKWWGVWPRICCTITQQITFSTSYGSGQKKILGKVTLWMCQKRQLPVANFNCRNLIKKDGCTQLVFLPSFLVQLRYPRVLYTITADTVLCACVGGPISAPNSGWAPYLDWTSPWRRPCAGFNIKTRGREQIKNKDVACSTAMTLTCVASHS